MKLRCATINQAVQVQAEIAGNWISLNRVAELSELAGRYNIEGELGKNLLAVLQMGSNGWAELNSKLESIEPDTDQDLEVCLPFAPTSFRDFMLFEKHVIDSSRGYVKRFMPGMYPITQGIERITGKPFGRFKPHALWYKQPIYYFGNHLNFGVSGDEIAWPAYSKALDYELELGAVLAKPLFNAAPDEATEAIGGFVVLNDFSARDVQKDEMESGFGPQKSKHFASTMSSIVVTADEILPHIDDLTASVTLNGVEVAQCHSGGMHFSLGEAIAFASRGEHLYPGELFGSGTLPGGTAMENGHWLAQGDTISLCIDRIGQHTNMIKGKG